MSKKQELGLARWRSAVGLPEVLFDISRRPGRRIKGWGWQGAGQPSAFLKLFLTSAGGRLGTCISFRFVSVWRSQARGAVTGADMVGDQLHGLVDPSGTPLHGCVVYQDKALPAVVLGAAEALSDVHSRVFEGSDPKVATVTGVDMVDDLLRGSVDPLGTPLHGCVEYQEGILPASATGAVKALPCAAAPVCSGQVHHDHVPPGRAKKNKKQATRRQDRIQYILRKGKAGRTADFSIKDHELFQWLLARAAKSGKTAALSNETKADVVGDQLRGLVDPSGTPLHGCVVYQDEALPAVAPGVAEALSDVHSRVFEGSDPEVATVTGVDMVDDLLRGSADPLGTPLHGCVEYLGTAVIEVEMGEIEMEGAYARAAKVDIIRGKEVNMYNIVVHKVMAITDVVTIVAADSGAEIMDPVKPESPCTSRWKWGDPRL